MVPQGSVPQPYQVGSQLSQALFLFQGNCEQSSVTAVLKTKKINVEIQVVLKRTLYCILLAYAELPQLLSMA